MKQIRRTAGSFAIVVAAYLVYALAVVPWIEPEITLSDALGSDLPQNYVDQQRQWLQSLFLEGDWERTSPKVLETSQGILLVKTYRNLPDGKMELRPCTVIFLPQDKTLPLDEQRRRAIVMRAPDGAILQFDSGSDLRQAKVGKLVGGRLNGPVSIRSDNRQPGPDDDLLIHTSDVELHQQMVWTSRAVDFQLGPNRGRGRRLQINLSSENQNDALRGMTSLELSQEVEMRFEPGQSNVIPGSGPPSAGKSPTARRQPPLEIRCRGPFRFDFERNVAEYNEQVDVTRVNPTGVSDQLVCDCLRIYFSKNADPAAAANNTAAGDGSTQLQASRVEAIGDPAIVSAPSNNLQARGHQIDYDVATGAATLRAHHEAHLRQGDREIRAAEIYARPDGAGQLAEFRANGAGYVRGSVDEPGPRAAEARTFLVRWSRGIQYRPYEGQQVLSIEGKARVEFPGQGTMNAEEIHVWLANAPVPRREAAGPANRPELRPERMLAAGNVVIDSPQVTANVDQLQAWFESPAAAPGTAAAAPAAQPGGEELPAPHAKPAEPKPTAPPQQRFHVEGQQLRLRSRARGNTNELAELIIDHRVRLTELPMAGKQEAPLLVVGDQLHLTSAEAGREVVSVAGNPAYIEARGLTLTAAEVFLNRGENRLWTETAGTMTLPVGQRMDGAAAAPGEPLAITWQKEMNFDGRTATFVQRVFARQTPHELHTELLEAVFSRKVDFASDASRKPDAADGAGEDRPEIERIECRGGVAIDSQTVENGRQVSIDHVRLDEMTLYQTTGELQGAGPGTVTSVRTGSAIDSTQAGNTADPNATTDQGKPAELTFINIDFQRSMKGNLRRHDVRFEGHVRTMYGPVKTWDERLDPDRPKSWPMKAMLLSCDRMTIAQLPAVAKDKANYELIAESNTMVEGSEFNARAARMTYAQGKDLLVLQGDGRTGARLYRQQRPGAGPSHAEAQRILYWPSTNRAEVDGAMLLDFSQLPGAAPK
ncbi:MAG TPA: hypothetical protein VG713_14220 [Pirellulales bacterium]|nr:hypothetical protein [Pirellulales bacterium]